MKRFWLFGATVIVFIFALIGFASLGLNVPITLGLSGLFTIGCYLLFDSVGKAH